MLKRYTCVKKITFVNFRFLQLGQYGGWVCCSNERVKTQHISHLEVHRSSLFRVFVPSVSILLMKGISMMQTMKT